MWFNDIGVIAEDANLLEFGILPEAGGWHDQNEFWARDVRQFRTIRARVMWEHTQSLRDRLPDGKDPVDALFDGAAEESAPSSWDDFAGG